MELAESSIAPDQQRRIAGPAAPIRLVFVISGLGLGGAEMMLWKLLSRIDRRRFDPVLISLSGADDPMVPRFRALGIRCELLEWSRGLSTLADLARLARSLKACRPDIIQGWMYYGNVAATLAARWAPLDVPVLWNVRATLMERRHEKRVTAAVIWLGGKLSSRATRIINNSVVSAREHEERLGYSAAKRVILPNGFDIERFQPSAQARASVRRSLGLSPEAPLVGMIARYHPMKGHRTFLSAAALVARESPDVHFVLAGDRVDASNMELAALIGDLAVTRHVRLLGPRDDVHVVAAACDIFVSPSSSGEGFPNVVGEAMSCGVPCVVTDVGDAAHVVGDTGIVVPPLDARAMTDGMLALLRLDPRARAERGARARRRAIEHFSLDAVVRQYEELYIQIHQQQAMH